MEVELALGAAAEVVVIGKISEEEALLLHVVVGELLMGETIRVDGEEGMVLLRDEGQSIEEDEDEDGGFEVEEDEYEELELEPEEDELLADWPQYGVTELSVIVDVNVEEVLDDCMFHSVEAVVELDEELMSGEDDSQSYQAVELPITMLVAVLLVLLGWLKPCPETVRVRVMPLPMGTPMRELRGQAVDSGLDEIAVLMSEVAFGEGRGMVLGEEQELEVGLLGEVGGMYGGVLDKQRVEVM